MKPPFKLPPRKTIEKKRWSARIFAKEQHTFLKDFDRYQGCEMKTVMDSDPLYQAQINFVTSAISTSLNHLSQSETRNEEISKIKEEFLNYFELIKTQFLKSPDEFFLQQQTIYKHVHQSNLNDLEKLSFEFSLGLARFDLANQLIMQFAQDNHPLFLPRLSRAALKKMQREMIQSIKKPFFERLNLMAVHSRLIIEALTHILQNKHFNYWNLVKDYFESHPKMKNLANKLVSMQYVPENQRFLGMAQVMHWNGLGGNAEILKPFELLNQIKTHAIAYHGNESNEHFTNRLQPFKEIRENLVNYVSQAAAFALQHQFPNQIELNLYDVCSGPKYSACAKLIDLLSSKDINLTISDVDGSSLMNAIRLKRGITPTPDHLIIHHVRYEDFNLDLPRIENEENHYHLLMAGIGFHQIPAKRIPTILNQLAQRVKPGGLILNPDVGEQAPTQIYLIPGNIVDREGYVPAYDQLDLKTLAQNTQHNQVRLVYPLRKLSCLDGDALKPQHELGLYMFNMFSVVEIKPKELTHIAKLWREKKYDECDKQITKVSGINVIELQKKVLQNLSQASQAIPKYQ